MKYKKELIFICLIICLFSIASVCASDVNETVVANEEQNNELISEDCNADALDISESYDNTNVSNTETENIISNKHIQTYSNNNILSSNANEEILADNYDWLYVADATTKGIGTNIPIYVAQSSTGFVLKDGQMNYQRYFTKHSDGTYHPNCYAEDYLLPSSFRIENTLYMFTNGPGDTWYYKLWSYPPAKSSTIIVEDYDFENNRYPFIGTGQQYSKITIPISVISSNGNFARGGVVVTDSSGTRVGYSHLESGTAYVEIDIQFSGKNRYKVQFNSANEDEIASSSKYFYITSTPSNISIYIDGFKSGDIFTSYTGSSLSLDINVIGASTGYVGVMIEGYNNGIYPIQQLHSINTFNIKMPSEKGNYRLIVLYGLHSTCKDLTQYYITGRNDVMLEIRDQYAECIGVSSSTNNITGKPGSTINFDINVYKMVNPKTEDTDGIWYQFYPIENWRKYIINEGFISTTINNKEYQFPVSNSVAHISIPINDYLNGDYTFIYKKSLAYKNGFGTIVNIKTLPFDNIDLIYDDNFVIGPDSKLDINISVFGDQYYINDGKLILDIINTKTGQIFESYITNVSFGKGMLNIGVPKIIHDYKYRIRYEGFSAISNPQHYLNVYDYRESTLKSYLWDKNDNNISFIVGKYNQNSTFKINLIDNYNEVNNNSIKLVSSSNEFVSLVENNQANFNFINEKVIDDIINVYYIVDGIEFHISSFQYNISKSEAIITFNESEISRDFAQTKCIKLYVTDEFGNHLNGEITSTMYPKVIIDDGEGILIIKGNSVHDSINNVLDLYSDTLIFTSYGYSGSKDYNIHVRKSNSNFNFSIKNNITYGENATVIVTTNVDGELRINMESFETICNVTNKQTIINIPNLNAKDEEYHIYAVFSPFNKNYRNSTETSILKVYKANPIFNLQIEDVNYTNVAILKGKFANNITGLINITVNGSNGFKTKFTNIYISNGILNQKINNLNASNYSILFEYGGNNNYNIHTANKSFNVFKIDPIINVEVNDAIYNQTACVIINSNVEGIVSIDIGSIKIYDNLITNNNSIVQNITNIGAGEYPVNIIYHSINNNYNDIMFNSSLIIYKKAPTVELSYKNIVYSQNATFNVKTDVDGIVDIKIKEYFYRPDALEFIKTVNTVANISASVVFENMPSKIYLVYVQFTPLSNNFEKWKNSYDYEFIVNKKETFVNLSVSDSVFGENIIINVTSSENGNLTIQIDNITIKQMVLANVSKQFDFGVLSANTYKVKTNFNAGENYKVVNNEINLVIAPAIAKITDIQTQSNDYGESTYIKVKSNVNGILTVNINNANKTFDLVANKLSSFNLGKFDAGTYDVDLILDAGSNYTIARNHTVLSINHKCVTINLEVNNNTYGNNVIVNVTASENGWIDITLGDLKKRVYIWANKISSVDFGILNAGLYNVSAKSDKGQNYIVSYNNKTLFIAPLKSNIISIQTFDYTYGNNIILNVKTDNNGILNAMVDNINKNFDMSSNVYSSIDLGIMNVGTYNVKLTFNAGINYAPSQKTISFVIKQKATSIIMSVGEYQYNENVIINVTSSEKGKVTIQLDNITKTTDVDANILTSIDFGLLDIGLYNIIANFTAGRNYVNSSTVNSVKVLSKIADNDVTISVPILKANQVNTIAIKLPNDAKGTVTLTIGNDVHTFDVSNGIANVKVPQLTEGNHAYTIIYSGDGRYSSFTKTGRLTVNKQTQQPTPSNEPTDSAAKITITLKTVKVKKSAKKLILQATLKQDNKALSGKKITFKFNGKTYKAKTNKKGIAKVTIKKAVLKKLKVGKKVTYQATYLKDTVKKTVKIKK